jgi:hypothetical protein
MTTGLFRRDAIGLFQVVRGIFASAQSPLAPERAGTLLGGVIGSPRNDE